MTLTIGGHELHAFKKGREDVEPKQGERRIERTRPESGQMTWAAPDGICVP